MMKLAAIAAAITFHVVCAIAQPQPPVVEWERIYDRIDDNVASSVMECTNGGYILGGGIFWHDSGTTDFWLLKTDTQGDCLWSKTFGGENLEDCNEVLQTADGGYLLLGSTSSYSSGLWDTWLLKTDANGDSVWSRTYGGSGADVCISLQPTFDGGYVFAGVTTTFGAGGEDAWLVKTDADGNCQWSRAYGGADGDDWGQSVVQTSDGGYAIGGTTYSYGAGWNDFWLIKTDAEGDCLWSRTYGDPLPDNCVEMTQTTDGGYVLAGCGDPTNINGGKFQLAKAAASGEQEWIRNYSTPQGRGIAYCVVQTSDGGYLLGGSYDDLGIAFTVWIVRTDSNGDSLWSLIFTGPEGCGLRDIIRTTDGGYALAGYKRLDQFHDAAWLAKLAPEMSAGYTPHPHSIYLLSAYPNPFNSTTQIEFTLPVTQRVSLRLYDVLGREVSLLLNEMKTAGEHRVRFDGSALSSGVYFCRMEAGTTTRTQKIVLIR